MINPDELKQLKANLKEVIQQVEDFLFVETKEGGVVPFILNCIQRDFVLKVIAYIKKFPNRPLRLIILKGRQFGFSTFILAWFFVRCLLVPNTRCAVVSHESDATKKLFRRVRFFAKTMIIRPALDKDSEKEYSFPLTNSYFYIGTAGTKAFGRGDNLTHVHCSEVAFWPNPGTIMNGLNQAVGKTGTIIIETTANGVGTYFYKLWKKSYRNSDSAWYALFFKWTKFAEYELEPRPNFVRTEEERKICELHPEMTDKKLAWRRWKISETETEPGFTPEQMFKQEYPLTPQEAFINSGVSVFDIASLEEMKEKEPIRVDEIGSKIWKEPDKFKTLTYMGIDSAEGLENHDRTVISIVDANLELVAQWSGWCDPDEAADIAVKLALRYNSYIVNEVNNMGIAINLILRKTYNLAKQYKREVIDEKNKKKTNKLGFRTSSTTKPKMVGNTIPYIRDLMIDLNDFDTIQEFMSFVKNGKGGFEASTGSNDDRVMSVMLALQGYLDKPPKRVVRTKEDQKRVEIETENKRWRADRKKRAKKKAKSKRLKRR